MSEPKPPYTVNPAVLKSIPAPAPDAKLQEAFSETVRLIREALQVSAPFTGSKGSIAVNYETWDTQCNVLLAIREKCNNWETVTPSTTLYAFSLFREISNLLTKAGY